MTSAVKVNVNVMINVMVNATLKVMVEVTIKVTVKKSTWTLVILTLGRIKRIITGVKMGVKVTVTVRVLMIKQKLKTLVSWPFEVIGGFKHCF